MGDTIAPNNKPNLYHILLIPVSKLEFNIPSNKNIIENE